MEFSPLRFLDNDASQMLSDQVSISQENKARTFHYNLYIFESIHTSTIPGYYYRDHNIICRAFAGLVRYWDDRWPDGNLLDETIKRRIFLYEQELKVPTDLRPFEKYSWE